MNRKVIFGSSYSSAPTCSAEGLAFIAAHEAATGLTMGDVQKEAVCGFVSRLQGNDTTYGSDIWTKLSTGDGRIWALTPSTDSVASAAGYAIELLSATTKGTFNNFISSDITPNGVIGGTTKYFESDVKQSNYTHSDVGVFVYSRTDVNSGSFFGVTDLVDFPTNPATDIYGLRIRMRAGGSTIRNVNSQFLNSDIGNADTLGFIGVNRTDTAVQKIIQDGTVILSESQSSSASYFIDKLIPFHAIYAININGSPDGYIDETSHELALYATTPGLTDNETSDFNEAVQWYQTNVITGGRNV